MDGNISYSNGKLSNGYNEDGTSGSGFKVGGEGLPVGCHFDVEPELFPDTYTGRRVCVDEEESIVEGRIGGGPGGIDIVTARISDPVAFVCLSEDPCPPGISDCELLLDWRTYRTVPPKRNDSCGMIAIRLRN